MSFIWRDVSGEPGAPARAEQAPELRRELIDLGFRTAGYAEILNPGRLDWQYLSVTNKMLREPIARKLTLAGWVYEVLAAPDGGALATTEMDIDGPSVSFRTVSENGLIVITGSKLPRVPRYRMSFYGLLGRFGTAELKPPETRAESGYYTERFPGGAAELWKIHRERVRSILEERGETIRPQTDPALYPAGVYQFYRMAAAAGAAGGRFIRVLSAAAVVLTLPLGLFLLFAGVSAIAYGWINLPEAIFILAAVLLFYYAAIVLVSGAVNRYVLPELPGPPPLKLDDLLKETLAHRDPPPAEQNAA